MSPSTEVATVSGGEGGSDGMSAPARKPGFFGWFWRGAELKAWQAPEPTERVEYARRARLAVEVARRMLASPEPFDGSVDPIACELYRQAIVWCLKALSVGQSSLGAAESLDSRETDAWLAADQSGLLEAAGSADDLTRVRRSVADFGFVQFAELAPEERAQLLEKLRAVASRLIAELDVRRRAVEAIWVSRLFKLGLVTALLLAVVFAVIRVRDAADQRNDLAVGKAWRASSRYNVGGCRSPEQECANSPDYFFHTLEGREQWLEIDLGSKQAISAVRVENRKDCCSDRAAPLVIEVSNDDKTWHAVATRKESFSDWRASFPKTEARWVRVRLEGPGPLHLRRVRVLP